MFSQGKILATDAASQLVAASVAAAVAEAFVASGGGRRRARHGDHPAAKPTRRAPTARSWSCRRSTTTHSRRGFCWSAPSATARRWPRRSRATRWSWTPWWGTAPSTRCSIRCAMLGAGHAAPPSRDPLAHQAGRHRGVRARAAGHAPVRRASRGFGRHAGLRHVHGDARGEQRRGEGLPREARPARASNWRPSTAAPAWPCAPVSRLLGRPLRRPFRAHRVKPPRAEVPPDPLRGGSGGVWRGGYAVLRRLGSGDGVLAGHVAVV